MTPKNSTFSTHITSWASFEKEPAAQIAHLVFANTQANPKKPKELFFATAHRE